MNRIIHSRLICFRKFGLASIPNWKMKIRNLKVVCLCRETIPFILINNYFEKRCEMWKISVKFQSAVSNKANSHTIFFSEVIFLRMMELMNVGFEFQYWIQRFVIRFVQRQNHLIIWFSSQLTMNSKWSFIQSNPMKFIPFQNKIQEN